jgi:hypothetical protein
VMAAMLSVRPPMLSVMAAMLSVRPPMVSMCPGIHGNLQLINAIQ